MQPGTVAIVGAGPGDPDLLTIKARRRLDDADRVLHDSLVGDDIVASIPEGTRVRAVGKRANGERTRQAEINDRLVAAARDGERVVRLKGGDPTVFGRGGEETTHLAAERIPFEIVPGISSVLAVSQAAGIPLTHRGTSSSLTVVTGHEDPDKPETSLDWDALADTVTAGGTLVVLMGVRTLPDYTRALRKRGVDPETPAAMIQKATWTEENTVTGTLQTIVEARDRGGIDTPAITVIGDIVTVGGEVSPWLGQADPPEDAASEATPVSALIPGLTGGD